MSIAVHSKKNLKLLLTTTTVLCVLVFFEVTHDVVVHAQAGILPDDEVRVLSDIAAELGKKEWNIINSKSCDLNESSWATPMHNQGDLYKNIVNCSCSFPGDVCHVIGITLQGQDLDGVLPPSLAKLPYIKRIDLTRNYLSGTIPPEWASTRLEYLYVCVNRLSGTIPAYVGNMTSLVYLSLESNMFSGTVPAELGKLQNLLNLTLNANNLSGELPMELNRLGHLIELRLSSNNFSGRIPSLESWKQLKNLEIHGSGLEGPIPTSISLLSNLVVLRISDLNGDSSPFPDLSNMTYMTKLMLRSCNMNGKIPSYISQFSNLKHLDLSFNDLVGDIPDLIGLQDLQNMYVTGNAFSGRVPQWLQKTGSLNSGRIHRTLQGQDLDGVLPPSLAKLPYIKRIDLTRNYLSGTIPPEWASTRLEYLSVCVNRLSGTIPAYVGNMTSLVYLSLESNMFSGTVPAELGKLQNLLNLTLNANNLSGELPMELNRLGHLIELRLSSNNFSGRIPSLESWKQLKNLEIHGSGLEGPIPTSISLLSNLVVLRISDLNGDSSPFPDLSNMTYMTKLMLRSCNMNGKIPSYISQFSNLKHLDLSFNDLVGDIPDLIGLQDLQNMYVTGNAFSGRVPQWLQKTGINIGYVPSAKYPNIDISYNNFSEEPLQLNCNGSMNLFRSYTGGNDSDPIEKCRGRPCSNGYMHSVHINCGGKHAIIRDKVFEADDDPAGASKFFYLPESWGFSSTGNVLDLDNYSYTANNVSILTMKDSELYTTARLSPLSITYYGRCLANGQYKVTLHFAEIVFRNNKSYRSLGRRAFDVYIQGAIKLKNYDIKNEAGGVDKDVIKTIKNIYVTNRTLEIRFQYVGKGTTVVPSKGVYGPLISAISMEYSESRHVKRTFIVTGAAVVAVCLTLIFVVIAWKRGYNGDKMSREKDLRGLDLKTGVFTYTQIKAATDDFDDSNKLGEGGFGPVYKGTLLDGTLIAVKKLSSKSSQGNREFVNEIGMIAGIQHPNVVRLHGCCVENNQLLLIYEYMENNSLAHALFENDKETKMEIDFPTRKRICVGVAKGLTFLHEESVLKMIHRDIKATNVLLDANLTPKISDFGLAKLNEEEYTHITTRVAGTIGYMAPEYALKGHLTYKVDVYSFGVLALEIVSGRSNTKYHPTEDSICLVDWVVSLKQKESLMDLVDPKLGSDFNEKEALGMIEIAMLCINKSPALRPTMSEVVNMLEGRIRVKKPKINSTSSDGGYKLQALKLKLEEIQSNDSNETKTLTKPSSSIPHNLYPNSQISKECSLILRE